MKTKKRLLDEPCTIASEPCTNTSKRRRVLLQEEDTSSSQQCNTYKKRRNTTSNDQVVYNKSKRRKLPHKTTISSELQNWSEFQSDLLKLIFEKLHVADAIRFTTVCNSWKRAAKSCVSSPTYTPLLEQPPLFMLPSQPTSRRSFFSSAEKKIHNNINTEFPEGISIVLSSHGWLLMSNICPKQEQDCKTAKTYLLNPLSGARIDLPPIPTDRWPAVHKAAISSDPSRNNNLIIVVIVPQGKMKFLKHGAGTTWTDFDCLKVKFTIDEHIVFYKYQLYVVSPERIVIWEFQGESNPTKREFQMSGLEGNGVLKVVESEGDLLFLKRVSRPKMKCRFYIYRFKIKDDAGGLGEWEKVETLMGRALFLGEKQSSMSLSTRSFPTLEGNSIYEAIICNEVSFGKKNRGRRRNIKVLVHNLKQPTEYDAKNEDEPDEHVYLSFKLNKHSKYERIWILPNPVIA